MNFYHKIADLAVEIKSTGFHVRLYGTNLFSLN